MARTPNDVVAEMEPDSSFSVKEGEGENEDNNDVVPKMEPESSFSVKEGEGETSHVNNSFPYQGLPSLPTLPVLEAELERVQLRPQVVNGEIKIADLGTPRFNALSAIDLILKQMKKRFAGLDRQPPEFQVTFANPRINDVNLLFQLYQKQVPSCYFALAPGSLHGRLFPLASIDVFHSAFALNRLSQVPDCVTNRRSEAYNKGRVFLHGATDSTARAYKHQFQVDLASFLQARAGEIKSGGLLFLMCSARTSVNPMDQGMLGLFLGTYFQDSWDDLVREGLLESKDVDSFNLPVYAPNLEEFREVVEANGLLTINRLDIVRGPKFGDGSARFDAALIGRARANNCRAAFGGIIDEHIGKKRSEQLLIRYERRITTHIAEVAEQLEAYNIIASLSSSG